MARGAMNNTVATRRNYLPVSLPTTAAQQSPSEYRDELKNRAIVLPVVPIRALPD